MVVFTKKAYPMMGKLRCLFRFVVYNRRGRRSFDMRGSSVRSNVLVHRNQMFRDAHQNAKTALFNMLGGSYKYNSYLMDWSFQYDVDRTRGRGKLYTQQYYNSQIPTTERNHESKLMTTRTIKGERTYKNKEAKRGIEVIRNVKNRKTKNTNTNTPKKSKSKRVSRINNKSAKQNKFSSRFDNYKEKKTNRRRNKNKQRKAQEALRIVR